MTSSRRPHIGRPMFLVYRECPCGEFICTGEGAIAPKCGACGGYFVPGGGHSDTDTPHFGRTKMESRGLRGLGFAGFLTSEMGAMGFVAWVRRVLGLDWSYRDDWQSAEASHGQMEDRFREEDGGPYYTEAERRSASDRITVQVAAQEAAGKAPDED